MGTERRRRRRVERTEDREQLEILCAWEEQREYERIRPLVLFGEPVPERAAQIGTSERALYWSIAGFEEFGPESPFGSEPAKRARPACLATPPHPVRRAPVRGADGVGGDGRQRDGPSSTRPTPYSPYVLEGAFPDVRSVNRAWGARGPRRVARRGPPHAPGHAPGPSPPATPRRPLRRAGRP